MLPKKIDNAFVKVINIPKGGLSYFSEKYFDQSVTKLLKCCNIPNYYPCVELKQNNTNEVIRISTFGLDKDGKAIPFRNAIKQGIFPKDEFILDQVKKALESSNEYHRKEFRVSPKVIYIKVIIAEELYPEIGICCCTNNDADIYQTINDIPLHDINYSYEKSC